jgi:hypothetical protein
VQEQQCPAVVAGLESMREIQVGCHVRGDLLARCSIRESLVTPRVRR